MGAAAIFNGSFIKLLKNQLKLGDDANVMTGSDDPTSIAKDAPRSSLYLRDTGAAGEVYLKQDDGSSTNWSKIQIGPLTGDVTTLGAVATIANDSVTYAKIQNVADARLLGRSAGSSGDVQEITIDGGLSLSAGVLTNVGATSVSNSDNTLTISPTTGAVVASLNLAKANTWLASQTWRAGTTAASTAPFYVQSGSLMTSPEVGAYEFLTDKFYGTITTGAARKEFTLNDVALTSGRVLFATTNGRLKDNINFTYNGSTLGLVGADAATVMSVNQVSTGTSVTTPFPAFELVNTNATSNNFVTFSFADAVSGASFALIGGRCTDHTNNYGDLHFWTRSSGSAATRMILSGSGTQMLFDASNYVTHSVNSTGTYDITATGTTPLLTLSTGATGNIGINITGNLFTIRSQAAGNILVALKAASSQSGNYINFLNSSATVLGSIDSTASIYTTQNSPFMGNSNANAGTNNVVYGTSNTVRSGGYQFNNLIGQILTSGNHRQTIVGYNSALGNSTAEQSILCGNSLSASSSSTSGVIAMVGYSMTAGATGPHIMMGQGGIQRLYDTIQLFGSSISVYADATTNIGRSFTNEIPSSTKISNGTTFTSHWNSRLGIQRHDPMATLDVNGTLVVANTSTLGSDVIVNGAFAADTDWTKGTNWTISGGVASHTSTSGTLQPSPALTIVADKLYQLTYTFTGSNTSTLDVTVGGASSPQLKVVVSGELNGTKTYCFRATTTGNLIFTAVGTITLDDVTLKEIQGGDVYIQNSATIGNGKATDAATNAFTALQPNTNTTISSVNPAFALVNTNTTNNNYVRFDMSDTIGGTASAIIATKFINHSTKQGSLEFYVHNGTSRILRHTVDNTSTLIQPALAANVGLDVRGLGSQSGDLQTWTNSAGTILAHIDSGGRLGLITAAPTAYLDIGAGAAGASNAPIKLHSGTNQTSPETGAIEYDGTNLFFVRTGTTRENVFVGNSGASSPSTNAIGVILDYYGTSNTRVLTTPDSWASVVISGTTYKIPLYL